MIKRSIKKIIPLKLRVKIREKLEGYSYKWHKIFIFFNGYKFFENYNKEAVLEEIENFSLKPVFSIVVPNPDYSSISHTIRSLEAQLYKNFELIIAEDDKIEPILKKLKLNYVLAGGTLQELLLKASGEYVGILYPMDELTAGALYESAKTIIAKAPDFIYTDNDVFHKYGTYEEPNYKPDFSSFRLLEQNYIENFCLFNTRFLHSLLSEMPLSHCEHYDLLLKVSEKTTKIEHLPKILYHQYLKEKNQETSINSPVLLRIKTIENALERRSVKAELIETAFDNIIRVKRKIEKTPLVSIIIPFKDKPELLSMCIDSILNQSTYINYEIIGVSNNSKEESTRLLMKEYAEKNFQIRFYENNAPFNFSSLNNFAVTKATGEHLILLNNDIEIISKDWIEALLEYSQLRGVGVVGAKLYYPNNTIQHAGIAMGIRGIAGHVHRLSDRKSYGYQGRLMVAQEVSAITAACVMVKKSLYDEVGGMEEKLSVAYNDLDLCLKLQEKGYKNIFTPYCEAYHHESLSRGVEDTPEKIARINFEMDFIRERYKKILDEGDPYYNVNLTLKYEDLSVK